MESETTKPSVIYFYPSTTTTVFNIATTSSSSSTAATTATTSILIAVIKSLLLGSIIICAVVGNALVILSVSRYHNLRTKANTFIVSLAFADLLVALLVMPFSASQEVAGRWLFDGVTCDLFNANDVLFSTASLLNLCCISLDRYIAITDPFNYTTRLNKCRVVAILVSAWLASILVSHLPIHLKIYSADAFVHSPFFKSFSSELPISQVNNFHHKNIIINSSSSNYLTPVGGQGNNSSNAITFHDSDSFLYGVMNNITSKMNILKFNENNVRSEAFPKVCCNYYRSDNNLYNVVNAPHNDSNVYEINFYEAEKEGRQQEIIHDDDEEVINEICSFQVNWLYGIVSSLISFWIPTIVMLFTYQKIFKEAKRQVEQIEKLRPTKAPPASTEIIQLKSRTFSNTKALTSNTKSLDSRVESYQSIAVSNENLFVNNASRLPHAHNDHCTAKDACLQLPHHEQSYQLKRENINKTTNNNANVVLIVENFSNNHQQSSSNISLSSNHLTVDHAAHKNIKMNLEAVHSNNNNTTHTTTITNNNSNDQLSKTPTHKRSITNLLSAFQAEMKNQAAAALQQQTNNENRRIKREHKAAKTLGIIMGVFLGCWLPFFIWYLTDSICREQCNTPKVFISFLFWVGYANSALNPLIYAFFNREFRGAFRKQLCHCRRALTWSRAKKPHLATELAASYSERHNWSGEVSYNKKDDI